MTPEQMQIAYALPVTNSYLGETTVRGYLKALLLKLWNENKCFSSKHSGWNAELAQVLIDSGLCENTHWDDTIEAIEELIKGL